MNPLNQQFRTQNFYLLNTMKNNTSQHRRLKAQFVLLEAYPSLSPREALLIMKIKDEDFQQEILELIDQGFSYKKARQILL